jgi:hypothetical protein
MQPLETSVSKGRSAAKVRLTAQFSPQLPLPLGRAAACNLSDPKKTSRLTGRWDDDLEVAIWMYVNDKLATAYDTVNTIVYPADLSLREVNVILGPAFEQGPVILYGTWRGSVFGCVQYLDTEDVKWHIDMNPDFVRLTVRLAQDYPVEAPAFELPQEEPDQWEDAPAHTSRVLTRAERIAALEEISEPSAKTSKPLPFNPDDFPLF